MLSNIESRRRDHEELLESASAQANKGRVRAAKSLTKAEVAEQKITSFATQILEITNGLKEYRALYKDQAVMNGFKENAHLNRPALAKMQGRFNSLKSRVEKLKYQDPRVKALFNKMIRVGIDDKSKTGGLYFIQNDVIALIGGKNIIDSGPFLKHGTICVKDSAMPDPRPNNLVSETELKQMKQLRNVLFNPKAGVLKIEGSLAFVSKTKRQLEKMLTYEAGRQILKELCEHKKELTIRSGSRNEACYLSNEVFLTHKGVTLIGYENGLNATIPSPPWIILGHELVHMLHHYSNEFLVNREMVTPDEYLWTDGEEYKTIGDPKNPINPISENGLREKSIHPLRIYHRGGFKSGPLEVKIEKCFEGNITGDLVEILRSDQLTHNEMEEMIGECFKKWRPEIVLELLKYPLSKEIIKKNLLLFFTAAKANGDEICVEKMISEFGQECDFYQGDQEFELFAKMMNPSNRLFGFWYDSSSGEKDFKLSKHQIIESIVFECSKKWNRENAEQLLKYASSKEIVQENLWLFFAAAKANGDEDSVEKMILEFKEECDSYKENERFELFVKMMGHISVLLVRLYSQSKNKKDFTFTKDQINEIKLSFYKNWDSDIFMKLLNQPCAKEALESVVDLHFIFKYAVLNKDENVLGKLLEMFPNVLEILVEMFPSHSLKLDLTVLIENMNQNQNFIERIQEIQKPLLRSFFRDFPN